MASGVIKAMASVTDVRDLTNVIQKATTSQPDSLSSLKTDLDAIAMTIGNNETINLKVVPSFSSDGFLSNINYRGFLHKTSSSTFTSFLSEDTSGTGIVISRTASTWGFNRLVGYNDSEYAALRSSIAIVSNGNTHPAILAEQLVYIYNHATLPDGIYKATSAIAGNASLTSSNVSTLNNGLSGILSKAFIIETYSYNYSSLAVDGYKAISASEFGITAKSGYTLAGIIEWKTGSYNVFVYGVAATTDGTVLAMRNRGTGAVSTSVTASVTCLWIRNEFL